MIGRILMLHLDLEKGDPWAGMEWSDCLLCYISNLYLLVLFLKIVKFLLVYPSLRLCTQWLGYSEKLMYVWSDSSNNFGKKMCPCILLKLHIAADFPTCIKIPGIFSLALPPKYLPHFSESLEFLFMLAVKKKAPSPLLSTYNTHIVL